MFKKTKEIISKDGVLHFRRWKIILTPWFAIYIHAIYKADEDKHLHNHPWNFWSFVLKGSYTERLPNFKLNPRFAGTHQYRDTWGYEVNKKFVDHETYRQMKHNNQL